MWNGESEVGWGKREKKVEKKKELEIWEEYGKKGYMHRKSFK